MRASSEDFLHQGHLTGQKCIPKHSELIHLQDTWYLLATRTVSRIPPLYYTHERWCARHWPALQPKYYSAWVHELWFVRRWGNLEAYRCPQYVARVPKEQSTQETRHTLCWYICEYWGMTMGLKVHPTECSKVLSLSLISIHLLSNKPQAHFLPFLRAPAMREVSGAQ